MKYRFLIIFIVLLLFCQPSHAIDKNDAISIGQSFLLSGQTRTKVTSADVTLLWDGLTDLERISKIIPPFYVVGIPTGGYVIIANHEAAHPIVGYSYDEVFILEMIPEGLSVLLNEIKVDIYYARERHIHPSDKIKDEWRRVYYTHNSYSKLLETAAWGQMAPFNLLCPVVNGYQTPTGCVNTATAIIMRYHKWPQAGSGVLPDYEVNGVHYSGHALGHQYDWDNMPLSYKDNYSDYQASQVAQLMYDIGIMNGTYYQPGASGALFPKYLAKYFDYDPGMQRLAREYYSDMEWESIIRSEIDQNRPVYYSAVVVGEGGHAFVIDGYDGDFFSVNFGWGVTHVYQRLSAFEENTQTIAYPHSHSMIINIKPNQGEKPSSLTLTTSVGYTNWSFKSGDPFVFSHMGAQNTSAAQIECELAYGLVDADGIIKEIISDSSHIIIEPFSDVFIYNIECMVTECVHENDEIQVCYRDMQNTVWHPIPHQSSFRFTNDFPLDEIISLTYEESFYFDLQKNCGSLRFRCPSNISWRLYDENNNELTSVNKSHLWAYGESFGSIFVWKAYDWSPYIHFSPLESGHKYTIKLFDIRDEVSLDILL